ncbi:MAG: heme exporter protein CcmB [Bacteroidetes Order II. Incertae sedis bacterium]|nr:heme exporter protein CcmB [Bacteroidetes Order II. bacterium]
MPQKNMLHSNPTRSKLRYWLNGAYAVFEKDVRLELRSRYALNMLLMFIASTLFLVVVSLGNEVIGARVQAALVWIILLFGSVIGLGRGFVSEVDQGTVLLLQLHTRGSMVYAGKLAFNIVLLFVLNVLALGAFLLLMNIAVENLWQLALVLFLGTLGLSGTTTLLAAMIARTRNSGPLLAVLAFPLLIPLLMSVVAATNTILLNGGWVRIQETCVTLVAFAGSVISASVLLFDYVWRE